MECPSVSDFKKLVNSGQIKNCPVTTEGVDLAKQIFGKDVATIKGRTTRKTLTIEAVTIEAVKFPTDP